MENKPQNVFDKLDKQGEQIDDISSKLEGISINDLYALAKRTWDYGDFATAQKYYNHISLLRPLDWEAPLYASLCNFKGYHNMFFWTKVPEQVEKIIISTIEYINNLEMDKEKKESEMSRCLDIIKKELSATNDHYFKYKDNYDSEDFNYIYVLQDYFVNIYSKVKDLQYTSIISFKEFLADDLLDNISKVLKISVNISKYLYDELIELSSNKLKCDYDELVNNSKPVQKLSKEDEKQIKLNGKLYFEYNDKVISKRLFKKRLITGLLLTSLSITGIVLSIIYYWMFAFSFILPLSCGLVVMLIAITQKDRINCYSILHTYRKRTRLTSNGDITVENCFSIIKVFIYIEWMVGTIALLFPIIGVFSGEFNIPIIISFLAISIIIIALDLYAFTELYKSNGLNDGSYSYYYNGNYYPAKGIY